MIDILKEFSYIALQSKAMARVVLAHCTKRVRQIFHSLMRALIDSARERSGDEGWLKNWVKNFEYCMVKHSISDTRLMYATQFRVAKQEHPILSVAIGLVSQLVCQFKYFLFNVFLKYLYIWSITLVAFENLPCLEQVFWRDYQFV